MMPDGGYFRMMSTGPASTEDLLSESNDSDSDESDTHDSQKREWR